MSEEVSIARPEVEGSNSYPTGSRFDTSTESYADGWPPTPTITESSEKVRQMLLDRQKVTEPLTKTEIITSKLKNIGRFVVNRPHKPITGLRANTVRVASRDPFSPPPGLTGEELFKKAREYEQDRKKLAGEI